MKKYFHIGKINFMNNIFYFSEFVTKAFFILIILFIFVHIWKAAFAGREIVEGFSLATIIWYLLFAESIVTSGSKVIREINKDIQSGEIAYQLIRPYSYIGYYFAKTLSYKTIGFAITFGIGSILVYLMVGGFNFNFANTPFLIISVFLALTLDFFILLCIALLAFWFEDTNSLKWIYDKILFTIGGMLLPLEMLPNWLSNISKHLPFAFAVYQPSKLFVNFNLDRFFEVSGIQIFYITIFFILSLIIYKIGIRRVNINGG